MIAVGKKGFSFFKKRAAVINAYTGLNGRYSAEIADKIAKDLLDIFISHEVDSVYVAYTRYGTELINRAVLEKFLDIDAGSAKSEKCISEPDAEGVLEKLIPRYLSIKVRLMILEAFTSEHAARAIAMKMATDNAKELLTDLVLLRNKVRQAAITQDIMEIISSSEALKG
jgi:F-type H+-transporting ATPase subunit gamma